jgi:hypothetical protein
LARVRAEAVFGGDVFRPLLAPVHEVTGKVRAAGENEILRRAKGAMRPPVAWDEFGYRSDDPERDTGTAEIHAAFRLLEEWRRSLPG